MINKKIMDNIFYFTIILGLMTVVLSGVTYYKGKQKEIEADEANEKLLGSQERLLVEMTNSQQKSDEIILLQNKLQSSSGEIIDLQNKLQSASDEIISLSTENTKQILGDGAPTLAISVYPDGLISLIVNNNNNYPLYDVSINFPNPDQMPFLKRMAQTNGLPSWDEQRSQWIFIPSFTLPQKTSRVFYEFKLSQEVKHTIVFLNIAARNAGFSGKIVLWRFQESFKFFSEVSDLKHKLLNEVNSELKATFNLEMEKSRNFK